MKYLLFLLILGLGTLLWLKWRVWRFRQQSALLHEQEIQELLHWEMLWVNGKISEEEYQKLTHVTQQNYQTRRAHLQP